MKLRYKIIAFIAIALTLLGLVCTCIGLTNSDNLMSILTHLVMFLLVIYYAFWGYQKPHGNLLKYLMLLFSLSMVSAFNSAIRLGAAENIVLSVIVITLVSYVAGRLDRIKQNKYMILLVLLILIYTRVITLVMHGSPCTFLEIINIFSRAFIWFDIGVAYFIRYDRHKAAGLADAEKKIVEA